MSELLWVQVKNDCAENVTVYLRHPRPKKAHQKLITSFILRPREASRPYQQARLVGAKDWDELSSRECIKIVPVPFEPRFVQVKNLTPEPLLLEVNLPRKPEEPERTATITIRPLATSRLVDVTSIAKPRRVKNLAKKRRVLIIPNLDIGPISGPADTAAPPAGVIGSYGDEEVYVCYDCGGPIVFRYMPPVPIHI